VKLGSSLTLRYAEPRVVDAAALQMAVLDVIRDDKLQEHARVVRTSLVEGL
jgi:hypothetical protein